MTKEDQAALEKWWVEDTRTHGWGPSLSSVSVMSWEACSEYKDKRIAELEGAGRELLIDAMNLYSHYPNNFRNDVKDYFEDEIKVFGISEGGGDE